MKKNFLLSIVFLIIASFILLLANCGTEEEKKVNKPPSCNITSPSDNALIAKGESVQISVNASDPDGSLSNVKISIDDVLETTLQSSPYSYSWSTSGVSAGQHNIKAVATDAGGLTAMSQISVTITAEAPTVTTADISEITDVTAVGGGEVTDDGGEAVTARGIVWGETSGPSLTENDGITTDGSGVGAFISNLASLTANTTYYVKAYATNSQGTAYGMEKSFMTVGLPTIVTGAVTDITNESANCSGEVTDDGGEAVTARGLVWGPDNADVTLENNDGFTEEGTGIGSFTSAMSSLVRFTDYTVRAYATNSAGTAYGTYQDFKTLPGPPAITTTVLSEIEAHTAMSGGVVTDFGGADGVYAGIVWSLLPNPDIVNNDGYVGFYNQFTNQNNTFEALLSGLQQFSTYYVRAWAQNDYGTTYGEEIIFQTTSFSVLGGTVTDSRDGKIYLTVEIYGQTWMAQNLAYLPAVCPSDTDCGYWVYDYQGTDEIAAKATTNYTEYGVLYNWEMAKASCPAGWHLPTTEEWSLLEMNIGMSYSDAYGGGTQRGTDEGGKLKETGNAHWTGLNTGATNLAGFNGLPGGQRDLLDNTFKWTGINGIFWTSSTWGSPGLNIYLRQLSSQSALINKFSYGLDPWEGMGFSVRCVQD